MSDKINTTDPAQVREWEERLAKFEGYTSIDRPKLGHAKWRNPEGQYIGTVPPNYSRSLVDLFRVLRKICKESGGHSDLRVLSSHSAGVLVCGDGVEFKSISTDLDRVVFGLICQYLARYHGGS